MKRSNLLRKKPLRRPYSVPRFLNEMKPGRRRSFSDFEAMRESMKPPLLRRSKLKPRGSRSKREAAALKAFRDGLRARSDVCEVCGTKPTRANPLDPHHIVPRSRAAGWPSKNLPQVNGLRVCRRDHESLTIEPSGLSLYVCYDEARERIGNAFFSFHCWRRQERKP